MSIHERAGILAVVFLGIAACGPAAPPLDASECKPACAAKACGDDGCGGVCGTCAPGVDCVADRCVARPTCADGRRNADETDVDCGGPECDACGVGKGCSAPADCASGLCPDGVCVAVPTCDDGKKNAEETDVDCGGGECDACGVGKACSAPSDCATGLCTEGVCEASPTCDDEKKNAAETDVDCGGGECDACAVGKACSAPSDCASGLCPAGVCEAVPTCGDGKKNGEETDVDCGGSLCGACATTRFCQAPTDCLSRICTNGVCRDPSCGDGLMNQGESDVDCGGPCSRQCGLDKGCFDDGDCVSNVCEGGTCVACRSTCPADGDSRCVADRIQTCLADGNGCFQWGGVLSCGAGRLCDGAENKCVAVGCGDVPFDGRCLGETGFEYCGLSPVDGTLLVMTSTCNENESCEVAGGGAACVLQSECQDGGTECLNASELRTCVGGNWTATTCAAGCNDSNPLEAFCDPVAPTTTVNGTLSYLARAPNAQLTNWGALKSIGARGFVIASVADMDGLGETSILDAVYTDAEGAFTLQVPTEPGPNDYVFVVAAGYGPDGALRHVLANPGFDASGEQETGEIGADPRVWSWVWDLSALPDLVIKEEDGSGAARVFDMQNRVLATTDAIYPDKTGLSLVTWVGMGSDWDCGACFARWPRTIFDTSFKSQIWLGGGADEDYWADTVTAHELGHWVMSSYGTSPNEGGTHWLGVPTFPGQAWSEGFATWFSSVVRGDPIYVDKQGGGMFWVDIAGRAYAGGRAWQRPTPAGGLLQKMDENEVSSMLWHLGHSDEGADLGMLQVFAEPQMNASPWARGYTRHTWVVESSGEHTNVVDTGQSQPSLPDFFDALMCGGFSAAAMDATTEPLTAYPYESNAPLCGPSCDASTCGCRRQSDCDGGSVCVIDASDFGTCRAACAESSPYCDAGFNCLRFDDEEDHERVACVPKAKPNSRWKLRMEMAGIRVPNPATGEAWDADGGLPDPFACVTVGSNPPECSHAIADTDTPYWAATTANDYSLAELADVRITVWDEDDGSNDYIGGLNADLSPYFDGLEWLSYLENDEDPTSGLEGFFITIVPND